jgi:hypothetical protein
MTKARKLVSRLDRSRPASAHRCSSASSFAGQLRRVADDVEVLGEPGGQGERLALPAATEQHRQVVPDARLVDRGLGAVPLAVERRALAAQHRDDDLQRLVEPLEPVGEGAELEAELLVLQLEPAGADAQHGPAAADHVEGGDGLGQHRRVAVGVAGDQRGQLDPGGGGGQRAERRVGLEHGLVGGSDAGQLVEVIHHERGVEAGALRFARLLDHGREELLDGAGVAEVRHLIAEANAHPPEANHGSSRVHVKIAPGRAQGRRRSNRPGPGEIRRRRTGRGSSP